MSSANGIHLRSLFVVLTGITVLILYYVGTSFPDIFFGVNIVERKNMLLHKADDTVLEMQTRNLPLDDEVRTDKDAMNNIFNEGIFEKNKSENNSDTLSRLKSPYIDPKYHLNATGVVKNKTILWWNPPGWLSNWFDDFNMDQCEYTNCRVSFNKKHFLQSDAVVYSIVDSGMGHKPPVPTNLRNPDQAWIFFTLESPVHVKMDKRVFMNEHWQNSFNWSWAYRTDADIFHPYGTLVTKEIIPKKNYSEIFRKKNKSAAWAVSHCRTYSEREKYESILNKYVKVDIFGSCGLKPPVNLKEYISTNYKFYLGFENSFCDEYMTEKFFNYYKMDLITIVRGRGDYNKYLPKGSFINTADFSSIKGLAKFLHELGSNEEEYIKYLKIKDKYKVYERDFMYRDAACNICEKLNNLDKHRKTYDDINKWLGLCYAANDLKESK